MERLLFGLGALVVVLVQQLSAQILYESVFSSNLARWGEKLCPVPHAVTEPVPSSSLALVEGQQLVFEILPNSSIDAYVQVRNISNLPVTIGVRIDPAQKNPLHHVNFCSGQACYPSFVTESDEQGQITLQPDEVDRTFKLQFDPQGSEGTSIIGVTMYNVSNRDDNIRFVVKFVATIISDINGQAPKIIVAPNPAVDFVFIEGDVGAYLSIIDFAGRQLIQQKLSSEISTIPLSMLSPGVYIIELQLKGYSTRQLLFIIR